MELIFQGEKHVHQVDLKVQRTDGLELSFHHFTVVCRGNIQVKVVDARDAGERHTGFNIYHRGPHEAFQVRGNVIDQTIKFFLA